MSLQTLKGVGESTEKKLNKLGVFTPLDLLNFLPKSYLDLSEFSSESDYREGNFVFARISVDKVEKPRRFGGVTYFRAHGAAKGKSLYLVWFNQPYMAKNVAVDTEYFVYGKLKGAKNCFEIVNPHFEKAEGATRLTGVVPVYPTGGLVGQKTVSKLVLQALSAVQPICITREDASLLYRSAHFPKTYGEAMEARRALVLETMVKLILSYKIYRVRDKRSFFPTDFELSELFGRMPFTLTDSQLRAVAEIIADLKKPVRMNRIICGDVGSGKTAVAAVASYIAAKNGGQTAFMAPTELLAAQHAEFLSGVLHPLGISVALLTGSTPVAEKRRIYDAVSAGEIDVLVGTESLFNERLRFSELVLAVTDEQQRFGVAQKTALEQKGFRTDSLVLSATPIPRALALIGYGELSCSGIERRFDRTNVMTGIVSEDRTDDMLAYVKRAILQGKQAFFVCPKIEDAEGVDLDSAKSLYLSLKEGEYKDLNIELLHGKMKAAEKQRVLQEFRDGKISALVCTTVIEVGIDVPNASIIAIMSADRFGLSALHQLRGRVGRDGKQAYCFLVSTKADCERLKVLKNTDDGFKIAEYDLASRGAGDYIGLRQSGRDGINDFELLSEAARIANSIQTLTEAQKAAVAEFYERASEVSLN